jgi:hypothetical protein
MWIPFSFRVHSEVLQQYCDEYVYLYVRFLQKVLFSLQFTVIYSW